MNVRKQRNKMLRILSAKKQRAFYESHQNTTREVLFESEIKDGKIYGHTDNYLRVCVPGSQEMVNTLGSTFLSSLNEDGVFDGRLETAPVSILL